MSRRITLSRSRGRIETPLEQDWKVFQNGERERQEQRERTHAGSVMTRSQIGAGSDDSDDEFDTPEQQQTPQPTVQTRARRREAGRSPSPFARQQDFEDILTGAVFEVKERLVPLSLTRTQIDGLIALEGSKPYPKGNRKSILSLLRSKYSMASPRPDDDEVFQR
eukprot:COSAG02_NODE_25840_length_647_cov_1.463504_1_plen_164_part_10